jgi:ubiquinone/menaquinone biosynthesis C-methylase UbiE
MNYWNDEVYDKKLQWNIWPFTEVISTLLSFKANNERINQKILEIGCGVGNNLIPIAKLGYSAYGVDISNLAIKEATRRAIEQNVQVDLICDNVQKLQYESNFFDHVIDRSVLTCTTPDIIIQSLDEIYRVLKPGGVFMAFDWFGKNHPDLKYGTCIGGDVYSNFSDGRFKNVEFITSFDFRTLSNYFKKFEKLNINRMASTNIDGKILTESFNLTAIKPNRN